jgi:hypothetical protein
VTYVVSESFVVATKRVKHAIKSDIPSIGDHISKLVHIGKATVDKLQVCWGTASCCACSACVPVARCSGSAQAAAAGLGRDGTVLAMLWQCLVSLRLQLSQSRSGRRDARPRQSITHAPATSRPR